MTISLFAAGVLVAFAQTPLFEAEFVFDPEVVNHGHVHASCIVECPNGDLRTVWYENGQELPPPYFNENRDKSDDVRLGGSRKAAGASEWEKPFVMADTFGVSDNNPCMVIDAQERLWLINPTLLGVPDWTWGSSLVRYRVSSDYQKPGPPTWETNEILVPHVPGMRETFDASFARYATAAGWDDARREEMKTRFAERLDDPLVMRLGWMPRAHPTILKNGTLLLPLSNENVSIPVMAFTSDGGQTWTFSEPVPEAGLTQPSVVEMPDGKLIAFFRNSSDPPVRIKRSESTDGGKTWSEAVKTDLPHPGAGIEAVLLKSGKLAMIYNDKEESPRDQLAVSLSDDGGASWKWTRHIENTPGERFDYPSLVQAADETLHASYSYNLKTIKHVHFNEAWIMAGD